MPNCGLNYIKVSIIEIEFMIGLNMKNIIKYKEQLKKEGNNKMFNCWKQTRSRRKSPAGHLSMAAIHFCIVWSNNMDIKEKNEVQ